MPNLTLSSEPNSARPKSSARQRAALWAGGFTLSMALGTRGSLGLFLAPLALIGVPIEMTALAVAVNALAWGASQPLIGAWADRYGAGVIQAVGALIYAAGFLLPALLPGTWPVMLGIGVLTGIGASCTAFGVSLAGVSRAFPDDRRAAATGLAATGGSIGMMLCPPIAAAAIALGGVTLGFLILAAMMLLTLPFGRPLDRAALVAPERRNSAAAIRAALSNRSFVLVSLGFFTCGFQLMFLSIHLPGYLTLCGMPASTGAWALTMVGASNIAGSYAFGKLGQKLPPQFVLVGLYVLRAVTTLAFFALPKTDLSVAIFALVMGTTWMATVPLTNGVVTSLFGVRDIGALFGICFISHQLGGFAGTLMGGMVFAWTGTYDIAFIITALAGFVAAAFNLPIRLRRPEMVAA